MINGEIKSKVDRIWDAFWSGGIANPMTVIEQISYLLFIKRLDEVHTARLKQADTLGENVRNPVFTKPEEEEYRWSKFRDKSPEDMFNVVSGGVFTFIKNLNGNGTSYARFMKDAVFMIPNPGLLSKVVDMLDTIPMDDRDTKGDLYEYLLSKLTQAGVNGQFRTPRHIIRMMVKMLSPKPQDIICDPACGTGGFLMWSNELVRSEYKELFDKAALVDHLNNHMFIGFDFDQSMLRIACMNMMLHGIENPRIEPRDSLAQESENISEVCTLLLANPPFKGNLDNDVVASDLLRPVKSKKTELLFINLFLRLLKPGGRCACIVPDGVLFGSTKAHTAIRKKLVEDHKLDAVISMPSGVFKPYAGVSTAILIFTRTDSGGTDNVWFYDMQADGYSLDDKRNPLPENDHQHDNIPDILTRWQAMDQEARRERTAQSFLVPKDEIAANKYDLSLNRYKELVYEEEEYAPPKEILDKMKTLERELFADLEELEGMLR